MKLYLVSFPFSLKISLYFELFTNKTMANCINRFSHCLPCSPWRSPCRRKVRRATWPNWNTTWTVKRFYWSCGWRSWPRKSTKEKDTTHLLRSTLPLRSTPHPHRCTLRPLKSRKSRVKQLTRCHLSNNRTFSNVSLMNIQNHSLNKRAIFKTILVNFLILKKLNQHSNNIHHLKLEHLKSHLLVSVSKKYEITWKSCLNVHGNCSKHASCTKFKLSELNKISSEMNGSDNEAFVTKDKLVYLLRPRPNHWTSRNSRSSHMLAPHT